MGGSSEAESETGTDRMCFRGYLNTDGGRRRRPPKSREGDGRPAAGGGSRACACLAALGCLGAAGAGAVHRPEQHLRILDFAMARRPSRAAADTKMFPDRLTPLLAEFPPVDFAFAYGSAVFAQRGYSDERRRNAMRADS